MVWPKLDDVSPTTKKRVQPQVNTEHSQQHWSGQICLMRAHSDQDYNLKNMVSKKSGNKKSNIWLTCRCLQYGLLALLYNEDAYGWIALSAEDFSGSRGWLPHTENLTGNEKKFNNSVKNGTQIIFRTQNEETH